ncbi:uncharacterized protein LOC119674202 [Teleopsis dalmanni]|uniref:uncharacterized protein LOC119674202 n=1 Tax=Teleopsis dalmanni TaxID=139649 RepID=UPI0018CFD178|nr:uncharacterized protein LOC119674202 [Teleopsis dalmanni]
MGNCSKSSIELDSLLQGLNVSISHIQPGDEIYLDADCNTNFIALVCLQEQNFNETLDILAKELQHLRQTRIVAYLEDIDDGADSVSIISSIMEQCATLKMLNVLLLTSNFEQVKMCYTYELFPDVKVKSQRFQLSQSTIYFPNKVANMMGTKLRTIPDKNVPRSIVYKEKDGGIRLTGYIGKLVVLYANKINATLEFTNSTDNKTIFYRDMMYAVINESYDLGASLSSAETLYEQYVHTYPVEIFDWFPMFPIIKDLENSAMFIRIFEGEFMLVIVTLILIFSMLLSSNDKLVDTNRKLNILDFLLNEKSLCGILGSGFNMKKSPLVNLRLIYFSIFLTGLLVNAMYAVHLKTFLTMPLAAKQIQNFEDVYNGPIKIMVSHQEVRAFDYLREEGFWREHVAAFVVAPTFDNFVEHRNNFNTSYGYSVTTSLWPVIEQKQALFSHKLFRTAKNFFFARSLHFSIPLQRNSIYKETLDMFILKIFSSGLMEHWMSSSFTELTLKIHFIVTNSTNHAPHECALYQIAEYCDPIIGIIF